MGVLPSSQSKSTTADDRRFCCVSSDSDEIWQAHTESNADDDESIKVKPEVEFQYGCRLFSETQSSNISAIELDILSKFGVPIVFDLLKICETSSNRKPEVDLPRCGCHLKN